MNREILKTKPFNTKKSILKGKSTVKSTKASGIKSAEKLYDYSSSMERIDIIREGIPYDSIQNMSDRLNRPIKSVLAIVGIPQTTYNKKKSEHSLLDSRNTELIVLINDLIDFGLEVFNFEIEKFQRWLRKPNLSLGGNSPESLLDTTTGIDEVRFCLNRIEFGSFA